MVDFCGHKLPGSREVKTSPFKNNKEAVSFSESGSFLVLGSNLFPIDAFGLDGALEQAEKALPNGKLFSYDPDADYFGETKPVPVCRAVLVARVTCTNGNTGNVFTSSYNMMEDGKNTSVHIELKQKGSQCHAEQFCFYRLEALILAIGEKKIESIEGSIRIKGSSGKATSACQACAGTHKHMHKTYPFLKIEFS